jgi:hypothetical protein
MRTSLKVVISVSALALAAGVGCAVGEAQQPHMQAALSDLMAARGELQVAEHNKGGHRVTAINLVNQAIGEVQAGMAAAD